MTIPSDDQLISRFNNAGRSTPSMNCGVLTLAPVHV